MKPRVRYQNGWFVLFFIDMNGDEQVFECDTIPRALWVLSVAYRIGTVQRGAKLT